MGTKKRTIDERFGPSDAASKSNLRDAWTEALGDIGIPSEQNNPDALTAKELSQLWGVSNNNASERAKKLVAIGRAVRLTKRDVGNRVRIAYLLIDKPKGR